MSCCLHYCSQSKPRDDLLNPDWMKRVPNRLISELTIPGAHDSCARINVFEFIQCQSWYLPDLLNAGIRFLDIRCLHYKDTFEICHDVFYCNITFVQVLEIIREFLKANPTETIIMRIQKYRDVLCSKTFEETFIDYYNDNPDLFNISNQVPYLDEVRGKIWVMFDFPNNLVGYQWNMSCIQDNYIVNTVSDIKYKVVEIERQFREAINGDKGRVYINFCSGVGYACWPFVVAENTNIVPFEYMGRLGIVVMDFPGEQLIRHLIEQNFVDSEWEMIEKLELVDLN
jgi:1-phosphatidylinositol phosphodiesterase